jgi:enoyl-CoA hydratase
MIYDKFQHLLFDRPAERVLRITLNRPERLNATNARMHRELADVWREVDSDPDVNAVIVTGAGRAFSAGGDFEVLGEIVEDFEVRTRVWKEARDIVYNVVNCGKPIVSAIRGPCVGAGLAVALLADIPIAARTARIVDGHTRLGVAAGDHAVILWPLLCGMARAKYYLLTCEPLTGAEAADMGLVALAVDDETLDDKAIEVATRLAKGPPSAVRWTKYALNNWLRAMGPAFDTSLALEFLGFSGPEVREGLAALREKREPDFPKDSPV